MARLGFRLGRGRGGGRSISLRFGGGGGFELRVLIGLRFRDLGPDGGLDIRLQFGIGLSLGFRFRISS